MGYNNIDFAAELREVRERKGLTISEMSRRLKTSTGQIQRIESGQSITINTLAGYLEQVGLDLLDVFRE